MKRGDPALSTQTGALLLSLPHELRAQSFSSLDACGLAHVALVCRLLRTEAVRARLPSLAPCALRRHPRTTTTDEQQSQPPHLLSDAGLPVAAYRTR
jgi:hypothetical protein